jgi:hypothetical protein
VMKDPAPVWGRDLSFPSKPSEQCSSSPSPPRRGGAPVIRVSPTAGCRNGFLRGPGGAPPPRHGRDRAGRGGTHGPPGVERRASGVTSTSRWACSRWSARIRVRRTLFSKCLESVGPPGAYTSADALLACTYAPAATAVLGCCVRTGTQASLTVLLRPWQNQTAGRGRGPTGGSSDACQHHRGGRRSPRSVIEP